MLPGDRLVCAFIEPQTVGLEFKTWMLHVTVVPWFRLPDASRVIADGLAQALRTIEPFDTAAAGGALFGPRKSGPVRLLREPNPFPQVEAKVRAYLHKKRGLLIDETTRRPPRFRPHVTMQGGIGVPMGSTLSCDRVYIVEQKGHYKRIMNEVILHGQAEA